MAGKIPTTILWPGSHTLSGSGFSVVVRVLGDTQFSHINPTISKTSTGGQVTPSSFISALRGYGLRAQLLTLLMPSGGGGGSITKMLT